MDFIKPEHFNLFFDTVKRMAVSIDKDGVKKELNSLVLDIGNTFKKAVERALVFYAKQGEAGEKNHKAATTVLQLYNIEYSRLSSYAKVGKRMSFEQSKLFTDKNIFDNSY